MDGSTEYASKSTPSATTQSADTLQVPNTTFEVNTTGWVGTNGTLARVTTGVILAGTASAQLTQSGVTQLGRIYSNTSLLLPSAVYMVKFLIRITSLTGGSTVGIGRSTSAGGSETNTTTVIASPVQDSTYTISVIYRTNGTSSRPALTIHMTGVSNVFRVDNVIIRQLYNTSIFAWVKTSASAWASGVNRKQYDTTNYSGYSLSFRDGTQSKPTFTLSDGVTQYKAAWVGTDINDGQWHFVAAHIDLVTAAVNNTIGISVDGGAFSTTTITTVPDSLTSDLVIGKYGTYYGAEIVGELQIVQGLNPTVSQLQSIVANGIPSSWSGATVAAHYKWGVAGAFLNDQTGNNNLTGTNVDVAGDRTLGTYSSFSTRGGGIDSLGNGKFNSLTVGSNGALIDSAKVDTGLAFSVGGVKYHALKHFGGSRVYDCGSIAAGVDSTFSVTCTGALAGNPVQLGISVAAEAGLVITAECTSNNTVTVRISNHNLVSAVDPASRTYKVLCFNF